MLIDRKTHIILENRKEARELLGESRYEHLINNKRLVFIDKYNPFQTPSEQIEWVKKNYPKQ